MTWGALFASEVRRALARRLVQVLVLLALAVTAVAAVVAYVNAGDDPATVRDLWNRASGEAILAFTATLLVMGAVVGGASVVGADWRSGTVETLLTWEPRRVRFALTRLAAAAVLAAAITVALQVVFALAMLPALAGKGGTEGLGGGWFTSLAGGVLRGAVLSGLSAAATGALAFIGRNTAAALGVAIGYLTVGENLVRVLWPDWARWLVGENGTIFLTAGAVRGADVTRSTASAAATVVVYTVALVAAATVLFHRRDVQSGG